MSAATFNSIALFTKADRSNHGSGFRPRLALESMPGVDGEFVQPLGRGGETFQIVGVLEGATSASTQALAYAALQTILTTKKALVNGATVAAFVDTSGTSYSNAVLLSYRPLDVQVYYREDGAKIYAWIRCAAAVRVLD